jgi:hypothetical protein
VHGALLKPRFGIPLITYFCGQLISYLRQAKLVILETMTEGRPRQVQHCRGTAGNQYCHQSLRQAKVTNLRQRHCRQRSPVKQPSVTKAARLRTAETALCGAARPLDCLNSADGAGYESHGDRRRRGRLILWGGCTKKPMAAHGGVLTSRPRLA